MNRFERLSMKSEERVAWMRLSVRRALDLLQDITKAYLSVNTEVN